MDSPTARLVRTETTGGVATITLDSPANRNALSTTLIAQLLEAIAAAQANPAVRVLVLSHTGPVFSAGADLRETGEIYAALTAGGQSPREAAAALPAARLGEVLLAIVECNKPVLARLAGAARAGGLGIVAAADVAVCDRQATFAFSEVRIGVVPAIISATVLPRLVNRAATELLLTGETFDGSRAEQIGLVSAAVSADELDATVARYSEALRRGGPLAVAATKGLLRRGGDPDAPESLRDRVAALSDMSVTYFLSAEGAEGAAAFREKRDASWVTNTAPRT